jgi:hypothetical protein
MGRYTDNGRHRKHPYMRMEVSDFDFLVPEKKGKPLIEDFDKFCKTRR